LSVNGDVNRAGAAGADIAVMRCSHAFRSRRT